MKKPKRKKELEIKSPNLIEGTEIVIISELLKDFENDFVFEEKSTFFDGGIEFKIIKVLATKESVDTENLENENNSD